MEQNGYLPFEGYDLFATSAISNRKLLAEIGKERLPATWKMYVLLVRMLETLVYFCESNIYIY